MVVMEAAVVTELEIPAAASAASMVASVPASEVFKSWVTHEAINVEVALESMMY